MSPLEEVWAWYEQTSRVLRLSRRLGEKPWNALPAETNIFADDQFKSVEGEQLAAWAAAGLQHLDDLAIVRLFAVFESLVRSRLGTEIEIERRKLSHPALDFAAREVLQDVRRGSFARVLRSLKTLDPDLIEEVRQVRVYRNWVCHGKGAQEASRIPRIVPKAAFDRLARLLKALEPRSPS